MNMKSNKGPILCLVLACLAMAACSPYEVGDWYRKGDLQGVVLQLDDNNEPTLLLLNDEARDLDADSAQVWAAAIDARLPYDCALPTKEEFELIRKYKVVINGTLRKKGQPLVIYGHTFYWSSTPCSESHQYACSPDGVKCYFKPGHSDFYRARAVAHL